MGYFDGCNDLKELKAEYKRLIMEHHPDRGGDEETMKRINIEHDRIFEVLKDLQNAEAERSENRTSKTTETPEEFRSVVEALLSIQGIEIELCGSWLWVSGEGTYAARESLKRAGCKWSKNKQRWHWHHEEDGCRWSRGTASMQEIRLKYGSELLGKTKERDRLPA